MKRIYHFILALASIIGLAGCEFLSGPDHVIVNKGFDVKTDVIWNADHMAYVLNLALSYGEAGEYQMRYTIDGKTSAKLKSLSGTDLISGDAVRLSGGTVLSCVIPALPSGKHSLSMEFERDGVGRSCTVNLPDTGQKAVGVEVSASEDESYTSVTLKSLVGGSAVKYTVSFFLDGQELEGMKYLGNPIGSSIELEFGKGSSHVLEMPYIVSGSHLLLVEVKSDVASESTSISFNEPQRRKTSLKLAYNSYTGRLTLVSDYNPLSTEFTISVGITVKGAVTYRHEQFFGIADPKTEYFTETAQASADIVPGINAVDIDGGALKKVMDNVFGHTKTDAANSIGNGNARTLHTDITSVDLKFTIHSGGEFAGETPVTISPATGKAFPITYQYTGQTWNHSSGYFLVISPTFKVNGMSPSSVHTL